MLLDCLLADWSVYSVSFSALSSEYMVKAKTHLIWLAQELEPLDFAFHRKLLMLCQIELTKH